LNYLLCARPVKEDQRNPLQVSESFYKAAKFADRPSRHAILPICETVEEKIS
jgi:hypothetical protein